MQNGKEYPATHSMSTAWYMVDEDGNVGIMEFNENGPVPWLANQQFGADELVFRYHNYENDTCLNIKLNDDQIDDLIEEPHSPEEEEYWCDCVVQIDLKQEKEFLKLAKRKDFVIELCVSQNRGLYLIEADTSICFDNGDNPKKRSALDLMIENKIITKVYRIKDFWITDDWNNGEVVHTKNFSSAPYYLYHQPYWTEYLPKCMNTPKNPVKFDQLPPELQKLTLKIPVKFGENETFQIDRWHPCDTHGDNKYILFEGCEYTHHWSGDAYRRDIFITPNDFINYCSQKKRYECVECSSCCHTCLIGRYTHEPTVIVVKNLFDTDISFLLSSDIIHRHCIELPYLPKIPIQIPVETHDKSDSKYKTNISAAEIKERINRDLLKELFQKNYQWLEETILRFNPHVIILSDQIIDIIGSVFQIDHEQIEIGGLRFPLCLISKVEENRSEIERLAQQAYRGKNIPYSIPMKEMEQIKKELGILANQKIGHD
jgi:hypothetical protein